MNNYLELAQKAAQKYLEEDGVISVNKMELPPKLIEEKAGVFVTVKKNGRLRGCIGTIEPHQKNIAKEIIINTISALTRDPRFNPVTAEELPQLSFEVYILDEPHKIESLDQLDPKKYGIIVKDKQRNKSALLLPDLKDIDTAEKQFKVTCRKAGLPPEQDNLELFRFTAEKFSSEKNHE